MRLIGVRGKGEATHQLRESEREGKEKEGKKKGGPTRGEHGKKEKAEIVGRNDDSKI